MNRFQLTMALPLSLLYGCSDTPKERPNIIFIMADDHAANAISAYGGILSSVMQTPNLDRIAKEGARMDCCCVTNSISAPSRGCIMTGQYSHRNGVYTLDDSLSVEQDNFAKELQKAGYSTAIVGKWHLKTEPSGFDYYNVLPGQGRYMNPMLISTEDRAAERDCQFDKTHGTVHKGHSTDIITDEAINWIQNRDDGRPFMLMCHFKAPHRSWTCAPRFKDLYEDVTIPEPENILDTYEGRAGYASIQEMSLEDMTKGDMKCPLPEYMTRDELRHWVYQRYLKQYLRCIAGIDENVGRILSYLDESGLADNTIVIYTSDQGFYLGEHGWFDKRYMQEESLRMPLLVRYPKEIKAGTVNDDIIINADFAPTLLDYAGVKTPDYMQGRSFRRNLSGNSPADWRDAMYYRYWMNGDRHHNTVANYGIRTKRYVLTFYYGKALGMSGTSEPGYTSDWEMFDLENDPKEMTNIYEEMKDTDLVIQLKKRLLELKSEYGDTDDKYPEMQEISEKFYW